MMFLPLPQYITNADKRNANYSLLFNKWIMFEGDFISPKKIGDKKIGEYIRLKSEFEKRREQIQEIIESQKNRTFNILSVLKNKDKSVAVLRCKVSDALICGIGDEHTLENSIRLDHCTGLPYIPSSSIKGVSRFAAEFNSETDKRDKKENVIFGSEKGIGEVQFWDGFPSKVPKLKIDIMNNHFQDYYSDTSGKIAPSDDMNPNPVPFIVVDADSEFYFPIISNSQDYLEKAVKFLKSALSEWGVGAKSSVGYGLFHNFEEGPIPVIIEEKTKELSHSELTLENLKKVVNPENFAKLVATLTETDEEWLSTEDLFAIKGFNIGFANKLFEAETIPLNIRKMLAQKFIGKIDYKDAKKRAEKKGDRTNLERFEKLKEIINS